MNRIFVDMDGVVVDFDGYCRARGASAATVKRTPGAFAAMAPLPGALDALDALKALEEMGFEVWLATKPPTAFPPAYADKAQWVLEHAEWLKRRLIIAPNKGLLGDAQDFLIDYRPDFAGCREFRGTVIEFTTTSWPAIIWYFGLPSRARERRQQGMQKAMLDSLRNGHWIDRAWKEESATVHKEIEVPVCDEWRFRRDSGGRIIAELRGETVVLRFIDGDTVYGRSLDCGIRVILGVERNNDGTWHRLSDCLTVDDAELMTRLKVSHDIYEIDDIRVLAAFNELGHL